LETSMSVRKCLSHKKEETIMSRSVVVMAALLILSGLVGAQEVVTGQDRTHAVARGETLWALAQRYLGNPYRWPLIFEANRSGIRDPHWIFPGQVLVIPVLPGELARVQELRVTVEGAEPVPEPAVAPQEARAQTWSRPTGAWPCPGPANRTVFFEGTTEGDRGCPMTSPPMSDRTAFYPGSAGSPAIESGGQPAAGPGFSPVAAEASALLPSVPMGLVYAAEWLEDVAGEPQAVGVLSAFAHGVGERPTRDRALMYEKLEIHPVEGARLQVGDVLQSFEVLRRHEGLGTVMRPTGILTVTAVEGGVPVAMVSAEFHRLRLGSRVRMAPDYDLRPTARAVPVESNVTGTLLGFPEDRALLGFGAAAFLDVGEEEGVVVGDEFGVFRAVAEGHDSVEAARLQVILVHGGTSTVRVVGLTEPWLSPGTPVRLVGKMR